MQARFALNWFDNERLTRELRSLCKVGKIWPVYTMRLGSKWADRLNPGDLVDISISNNPDQPNTIGNAEVLEVKKKMLSELNSDDPELKHNIGGSKTPEQVIQNFSDVYGVDKIRHDSVVSIIKLSFQKGFEEQLKQTLMEGLRSKPLDYVMSLDSLGEIPVAEVLKEFENRTRKADEILVFLFHKAIEHMKSAPLK